MMIKGAPKVQGLPYFMPVYKTEDRYPVRGLLISSI